MAEIRNPNQQGTGGPGGAPGGSSNLLMYFSLFILVFLGLQYFRKPQTPAPPAKQAHTAPVAAPAPVAPPPQAGGAPSVAAAAVTPITVENAL